MPAEDLWLLYLLHRETIFYVRAKLRVPTGTRVSGVFLYSLLFCLLFTLSKEKVFIGLRTHKGFGHHNNPACLVKLVEGKADAPRRILWEPK